MSDSRRSPVQLNHQEAWATFRGGYLRHGTHIASSDDLEALQNFRSQLDRLRDNTQIPHYHFYSGWLDYELATAERNRDKGAARDHYSHAELSLRMPGSANDRISFQSQLERDIQLIRLEKNRLYAEERQKGTQHHATIAEIGRQTIVLATRLETDDLPRDDYSKLIGMLSETAVAGVLLTLGEQTTTSVVAPATPRQNSPWLVENGGYRNTPDGARSIQAFDFIHLVYEGAQPEPASLRHVQVKTRFLSEATEARYADEVTVLYADRDLFVATTPEFIELGSALETFGTTQALERPLEIARSNVELAFEAHDTWVAEN
ncbi:MAG: hypothetical protein JWN38_1117 [Candidatus Saccharibacteria bacterium]|nr:hypothetical protein [Candidatus Saccharibacteria bacterium]